MRRGSDSAAARAVRRSGSVGAAVVRCAVRVACAADNRGDAGVDGRRWARALAAQDGNAVAKLTCRAAQADNQTQRLQAMGLGAPVPPFGGGAGAFGGGGGGNASFDVSDLAYQTTFVDYNAAKCRSPAF